MFQYSPEETDTNIYCLTSTFKVLVDLTRLLGLEFLLFLQKLTYEDIFLGLPCKYLGKLSTKFNKIFLGILSRLTKNVIH